MTSSTTPGSGLALLPTDGDSARWSPKERAIMDALGLMGETKRRMIQGEWQDVRADPAPAGVVEMFLSQARRLGLDPMAKQIYCIQRGGKWGIQASIDGFRLIAERSQKYQGQTAPQWCGPDGVWREVWLEDFPPAASRVGVHKDGFVAVTWGIVTWAGYCPRDKDGNLKPTNQWLTNGANQLAKCAEMLALRKAFPQDLSGIYGQEEMDHAEPVDITATATVRDGADEAHAAAEASQVAEAPAGAVKAWQEWKEAIDAVPDKQALGALYKQAAAADMLNKPIPLGPIEIGEIGLTPGAVLGDYFMVTAGALPDTSEVVVVAETVDEGTGEVTGGEPPLVKPGPDAPAEEVTEWATTPIPDSDPTQGDVAAKEVGDDVPF